MAHGKGLFHDFPIAISKTAVTFNRFGIVTLDKLQSVRWKQGKGRWQKYGSKMRYPTFEQLMKWPVTERLTEPTYNEAEIHKQTWERQDCKKRRKAKRAQGKRKKIHGKQAKLMQKLEQHQRWGTWPLEK